MRPFPPTGDMKVVARRVIWFEEPEQSLSDPVRFLAHAMAGATHEDMQTILRHVTDEELREDLDNAPPGIIDPRSLSYWNLTIGRHPAPPMPKRHL